MGWESRNGLGRYYTRSRKQNGRVVREYVGSNLVGELAFENDRQDRAIRQAQRQRQLLEKSADRELDMTLKELDRFMAAATEGLALIARRNQHDLKS